MIEHKLQTLPAFLGVVFGTLAYVTVSGFFLGFQHATIHQLVNSTAQIHIRAREDFLTEHQLDRAFYGSRSDHVFWDSPPAGMEGYFEVQNPQSWYERLKADPRVEAFSPLLTAPALFNFGRVSVSANILGCNPTQQEKVTNMAQSMTEGRFEDIAMGGGRVILGDELAKRLGAAVNHIVMITVGTRAPVAFKVVGRFSSGNPTTDLQAYASLNDVQKINGTPNRVNEIAVRLKNYKAAAAIASDWSKIAPEKAESWDQQNAKLLSVFATQTALCFAMAAILAMIAGFGVYLRKRQGIAMGMSGALAGSVGAYLLCGYLQISASPMIYAQAILIVLIVSLIASRFPARASGKMA